ICISISTFLSLLVFSQDKYFTISGKVIDAKSQQPLVNASVFCQNTTIGSVSNADGNFFLRVSNGGYDLVISYTGYETRVIRISNSMKEKDSMRIELKEQDKAMTEVVVAGSAEVADGWTKYGRFFIDNFIGTSPNADSCTIQNKDAVHFYFYKKRNKLKVKAGQELIIFNNALGYKIKYQLDSFVYDYNNKISSYTGYPLFEELTGNPEQQNQWKKNRFISYKGSRLHFMRCWYDSTLRDEGFDIELMDSITGNTATVLQDPYDSRYYSVDSGDVEINIKGKIRINYKNRVPDRRYLVQNNYPTTARVQISALDIIDGFTIEENGYFYEQSEVTNVGYWAWKKLSELLPYDYNPE
ncbi:MAG TPA: carboxypeptidase-like regulatory domain-containing protein, partial [Puia sp.]|nr:carboxypeptidase-like regulatory domain-containing protein [Puia sp.]